MKFTKKISTIFLCIAITFSLCMPIYAHVIEPEEETAVSTEGNAGDTNIPDTETSTEKSSEEETEKESEKETTTQATTEAATKKTIAQTQTQASTEESKESGNFLKENWIVIAIPAAAVVGLALFAILGKKKK